MSRFRDVADALEAAVNEGDNDLFQSIEELDRRMDSMEEKIGVRLVEVEQAIRTWVDFDPPSFGTRITELESKSSSCDNQTQFDDIESSLQYYGDEVDKLQTRVTDVESELMSLDNHPDIDAIWKELDALGTQILEHRKENAKKMEELNLSVRQTVCEILREFYRKEEPKPWWKFWA